MTDTALGKVEIILDSGARSRDIRLWVEALQQFFRRAEAETGEKIPVVYVDTPQLFHEKTGYVTPDQAPEQPGLWPLHLQGIPQEMRRGMYEITESSKVAAEYYVALQDYVFDKQMKTEPSLLREHGVNDPEDLQGDLLQSLFDRHVRRLPKDHPDRGKPAFKEFAKIRADSGERSVAEYLRNREIPESSGKVITLFVAQDHAALKNVDEVANQKGRNAGEAIFSVNFQQAKGLMQQLVREYKTLHPETAAIEFNPDMTHPSPSVEHSGTRGR